MTPKQQAKTKRLMKVMVDPGPTLLLAIEDLEEKTDITNEDVKALAERFSVTEDEVKQLIEKLQSGELKGEKGDSIKGDSYILTELDKKEIAKKIDVPVVEKVIEVIKEQPIVTEITKIINEIKEVAIFETPEQIVDKVNTSSTKVKKEVIEGIEQMEENINTIKTRPISIGGRQGMQLYTNGTKRGLVQTINLIAGTGITLTYTRSYGRNDVLIDATGSSLTALPATGAINSVNTAFVFTEKPTYIISDGAFYRENSGWTWNAGLLTATMTIPPNDDLYGLVA